MPGLRTRRAGQRGQTLPIFALASLFIIGVVALAVDYGFLTNQHRNLQAFADEGATAGAIKLGTVPGPTEYANARKAALIYIRDNLGLGGAGGAVPDVNAVATACNPGNGFAKDLGTAGTASCALGTSSYKVSIWSPADGVGFASDPAYGRTVSVRISEGVTTALAGVFSFAPSAVGAYAVAQAGPGQSNYALYSDGCVNIRGSKTEIVAGDAYINQCTLAPGTGAFCTYGEGPNNPSNPRLGGSAGDATFGPYSNLPLTLLPLQTQAGCTAAAVFAGRQFATGNIGKSGVEQPPPSYAPPPNVPTCTAGVTCAAAATSNALCTNGAKGPTGATATGCFTPGAYSTIGPIANNLDPGVYHIYGDPTSACYRNPATTNCPAVVFGGNTINANFPDVMHHCWAAPNVPATGNFGTNCPDGFIDNPTLGVNDPMCSPGCPLVGLATPTFALTASATGGSLDPVGTGTLYYIRVTAYNSFGDSVSNELAVNVISPLHAGSINVTITGASPGATGYHIYGPSLTPGTELLNAVSLAGSATVGSIPSGSRLYSSIDTSVCKGFCNVPQGSADKFGVTFVLEGKAGVCVGHINGSGACDSDDPHPIVMLAPYCGSTFASYPSGAGADTATTYVCPNTAVSTTDGAFVFYGPSEGTFWVGSDIAGGIFDMTGVLYLPRAFLNVDRGLFKFHVVPGQVVVHNLDIRTANAVDPDIFWGQPPPPPVQVRIIQ